VVEPIDLVFDDGGVQEPAQRPQLVTGRRCRVGSDTEIEDDDGRKIGRDVEDLVPDRGEGTGVRFLGLLAFLVLEGLVAFEGDGLGRNFFMLDCLSLGPGG
jgi:hypothetical protein